MHKLTPEIAQHFAEIALRHVTREYPHKLDHVMSGPEDVMGPRDLHPIFFGSFDWHSCVHGYWLLLRVRRLYPDLPVARRIEELAESMITSDNVLKECSYLERPLSAGFERPYGWAWLLALHREAQRHEDVRWADRLAPLALAFANRFKAYLPKLSYPIRVGTHFNTAFALVLALEWAEANDEQLVTLITDRARYYFGSDRNCPAWEPGGDEFLSPAMIEVLCMKQALAADEFGEWLNGFLPHLQSGEPQALFEPAFVSDRSDGKIAHLDGFNLSRAWCWRAISDRLDQESATLARSAAERHLSASLSSISGDYMGEHWLATFAMLALQAAEK